MEKTAELKLGPVTDDTQHTANTQGELEYKRSQLLSIIRELGRKNCIAPSLLVKLKEKCKKIKNFHDLSAGLKDLGYAINALKLPAETTVTIQRSTLSTDDSSVINEKRKLEQANEISNMEIKKEEELHSEELKFGSVTDGTQHTFNDSVFTEGSLQYYRYVLLSIIKQLERKNCFSLSLLGKVKENCEKIKNSLEVAACLRDLADVLKLPAEATIIIRRSTLSTDDSSVSNKKIKLEQPNEMSNIEIKKEEESNSEVGNYIYFVSGNPGKMSEADSIMKESHIKLKYMKIDLPEYQGGSDFISEAKCKSAASIVKGPVITEDTSLAFDALHGLPGPYVKWFVDELGPDGLHKLLSAFEDKSASAICTLAFSEGSDETVHLFRGITRGKIVPPKGSKGFGWDQCFLPEGKDKTYAELTFEEKNIISHRRKALMLLKDYLSQRYKS